MKVLKTIGDVALIVLSIISCLIILGYVFYLIFVPETTIGTNNISDQIAVDVKSAEEMTEEEISEYEERWFMEANYYSNAKNNGIELQELNFNYFTSHKLTQADYRATGMQYIGDFQAYKHSHTEDTYVMPDFYYYDTTDGVSFNGYSGQQTQSVATLLNRANEFIIKIDNRPFTIKLDGSYGWWIFATNYDYGDLFANVFDAIESNSAGYGDYYITLDLSYFFSIKEMDANGKYIADDVTDIIKNYAVLKFHYDENGASRSSQSLFKTIENNSSYNTETLEFWDGRMIYTLSEEDLVYRYSEAYKGYFVSLSNETKVLFDSMPTVKLLVTFDFASLFCEENEYNVVGFDYGAFAGFDIDTLTVKAAPGRLYVMSDAFRDAELDTLRYSNGIVFEGVFGIEFEEEVI